MSDLNRMERTWLCSVLFMDIAQYSKQSVEVQMKWKRRFNGYLGEAIQSVPEDERIILDTGDGAAICFLGAPEAAMFAALQLCRSFILDEQKQRLGLRVRLGINLGPVKLIKDINGSMNAIGDGINAGQRIMSFASENQILVSQSFFEVASRLSDDYKLLFKLKGVEKDKHIREHTVYHLVPPGAEKLDSVIMPALDLSLLEPIVRQPSPSPAPAPATSSAAPQDHAQKRAVPPRGFVPWLLGGAALVVLAAAGAWYFYRPAAPPSPNPTPSATAAAPAPPAAAAPGPSEPAADVRSDDASPSTARKTPIGNPVKQTQTPLVSALKGSAPVPPPPAPAQSAPAAPTLTADAKAAYDEASTLLDQDQLAEAVRRFDDAIRASPDYIEAYVGRAEARRRLSQYELSAEDCNKIIMIKPDEPRGYNCRGLSYEFFKQYDRAVNDFNEAIRLNPNFALAYDNRGSAYSGLQQYDRAVQDYSQAIRLRPRNGQTYFKRAAAYSNLKQYDKAVQDYTAAIQRQPNNGKAYSGRAAAEDVLGDAAGAAADRSHVRELRKQKK